MYYFHRSADDIRNDYKYRFGDLSGEEETDERLIYTA